MMAIFSLEGETGEEMIYEVLLAVAVVLVCLLLGVWIGLSDWFDSLMKDLFGGNEEDG